MSTTIILLIITSILSCSAVLIYFGYMKISNELYARLVESDGSIKSPYRIKRSYSPSCDKNYYFIYRNNDLVPTKPFTSLIEAQESMNELEQLGGYKKTKVAS